MTRKYSRSIQQVYALEGWRGTAKLFPELEGRTDSAKRSFVYRVAKGYPSTGKQEAISKQGKTNVQRRAGRLLARKVVTDSKGEPVLDNDGEVMKTAISPTNNVKLAIKSINSSRASERRLTRQALKSGRITPSVSEYNLQKNATLSTAEKNALYRNLSLMGLQLGLCDMSQCRDCSISIHRGNSHLAKPSNKPRCGKCYLQFQRLKRARLTFQ